MVIPGRSRHPPNCPPTPVKPRTPSRSERIHILSSPVEHVCLKKAGVIEPPESCRENITVPSREQQTAEIARVRDAETAQRRKQRLIACRQLDAHSALTPIA